MTEASILERRLERFRLARVAGAAGTSVATGARSHALAERLAARLDGEILRLGDVVVVRVERPGHPLPVDRDRLATLPGQPPPDARLLCLDTETTGLGTATGTFVFLVGLGWWEAERFRQVQLILPDQADEPALLSALTAAIPRGAWLVTYNGRSFDWPLLETRYRMRRSAPPDLAGHLDLLPLVRRLFRHRLPDARLRTVELHVLGLARVGDVEGPQIPGRYLDALRWADPEGLVDVVHHNHLDVRALAHLVAHLETRLGDEDARRSAHPGDLAGLARAYRREGRLEEALACLEMALARAEARPRPWSPSPTRPEGDDDEVPWWSPRARADVGGRPRPALDPWLVGLATPPALPLLVAERARILRRLGRIDEAIEAWRAVAAGGGRVGASAWVEIAKLREHVLRDPARALDAVARSWSALQRARALGRPDPHLEQQLAHRAARLRRLSIGRRTGRPPSHPAPRTTGRETVPTPPVPVAEPGAG